MKSPGAPGHYRVLAFIHCPRARGAPIAATVLPGRGPSPRRFGGFAVYGVAHRDYFAVSASQSICHTQSVAVLTTKAGCCAEPAEPSIMSVRVPTARDGEKS